MFHSFTHEATDDGLIDVHFVRSRQKSPACVTEVHVDDNQLVKKGDVLVEIDPRDFQIALAQAKANLAKDKAGRFKRPQTKQPRAGFIYQKGDQQSGSDSNRCHFAVGAEPASKPIKRRFEQAELNLSYQRKSRRRSAANVTKEAVAARDMCKWDKL